MTTKTEKDPVKVAQSEILSNLRRLGGGALSDDGVVFDGTKIVLPRNTTIQSNIDFLEKYQASRDEQVNLTRSFDYRPWDGAHAFAEVCRKYLGMTQGLATPGFFGSKPPQGRTINIGPGETIQIPWGSIAVSCLPESVIDLEGIQKGGKGLCFQLDVYCPKRYTAEVHGIFDLVQKELETNSIYRGKAIDGQEMPEFLDLSKVDPAQVIYSDELTAQLDANLWSLLRYTQQHRDQGLPLKRAVLLTGTFGGGKTLAGHLTAQKAVEAGWTFLYVRPGRDNVQTALSTAKLYQPAVVFFEDVDTVTDPSNVDSDQVTRMLDTFDGVAAKGAEIVGVFTTNHEDRIHKGMLRPGRLDSIIHFGELDESGVMRMIRACVPEERLGAKLHSDVIFGAMHGYMPAFVKEVIDRAKRYSMARNQGVVGTLETDDFVFAANGLRPQYNLMVGANEHKDRPTIEVLTGRLMTEVLHSNLDSEVLVNGAH